jgi:hypothetical protein
MAKFDFDHVVAQPILCCSTFPLLQDWTRQETVSFWQSSTRSSSTNTAPVLLSVFAKVVHATFFLPSTSL